MHRNVAYPCAFAGLTIALLAGSSLLVAAQAQTVGTYTGKAKDGSAITLTVAKDSNKKLAITAASISFESTCMPGGTKFSDGWGYGQDALIKEDKFSYTESFPYLYEVVKGTFSGDTITGTISSLSPTFAAVTSGAPKKSVFCKSPVQSFTATLSTTAVEFAPPEAIYNGLSK